MLVSGERGRYQCTGITQQGESRTLVFQDNTSTLTFPCESLNVNQKWRKHVALKSMQSTKIISVDA